MIQLFLTFLKIGFLGFGGGYAMLSLIYENSLHLGINATQFADLNALDLLAPGPIAVNSSNLCWFYYIRDSWCYYSDNRRLYVVICIFLSLIYL
ncbi:chromate transporter [Erysipelothrix sp. D19-032]